MIDDDFQKKLASSTDNCKNVEHIARFVHKEEKKKEQINSEINREIRINSVNRDINRAI